jgi:hypothetical protein
MKNLAFIILLLTLCAAPLHAEWVFMKDGRILPGEIVRETDQEIRLLTRGRYENIPRENIQRILLDDTFQEPVWLYKKNMKFQKVHIVDEDNKFYYVREDLDKPEERKIRKKKIAFISYEPVKQMEERLGITGDTRFDNLFGIRAGSNIVFPHGEPGGPGIDTHYGIMAFYYYDKWFEINLDFVPGGGASEKMFMCVETTAYPFYPFNLPLGISLGYMTYQMGWTSLNDNYEVKVESDYIYIGVTYRLWDRLRLGLAYMFDLKDSVTIDDFSTEYHYTDDGLNLNLMVSAEYFVWRTLSLRFRYAFMNFNNKEESGGSGSFGSHLRLHNHYLEFSVGYGFRLP